MAISPANSPPLISNRLKKDSRLQSYVGYSLVTAVVALALSAVYGFNFFEQWKGALQRVSMGVPLLWIEVMAIKLLRLSIRSGTSARLETK